MMLFVLKGVNTGIKGVNTEIFVLKGVNTEIFTIRNNKNRKNVKF